MKVGDIVELSAYGKGLYSVSHNSDNWGIVIEPHDYQFAWKVKWYRGDGTCHTAWNNRKEIKYLKLKK